MSTSMPLGSSRGAVAGRGNIRKFFNRPHMPTNACLRCGCNAQRFVNAAEIVVHVVNRHAAGVILGFF